jgi:hypothetical protein
VIAAFLGSGQRQTFAQKVEERNARIKRKIVLLTGDTQRARDGGNVARGLGFSDFSSG